MKGVIVDSSLKGHPFIRFYLVDREGIPDLQAAGEDYDYAFAYSRLDLGDLDGFWKERKWAQILNLDGSPDDVFASLHKNDRRLIRKTHRDDGVVVVTDDPDHAGSYQFYQTVKEADGVLPDIEEDFEGVRWVNCYYRGELVSSNSLYDSGVAFRHKHTVSVRKEPGADVALIGEINRRLLWECCLLGINEGRAFFDMGGLDPKDPTKRGITEYKQRFGGETVEVFVYRRATEAWQALVARERENGRTVV